MLEFLLASDLPCESIERTEYSVQNRALEN